MGLLQTVESAREFLERNGRVSLRALQRESELDDDALAELIEELAEVQRVAAQDRNTLAWTAGAPPASTVAAEHERSPRAYTPRHLADKILQSRFALEGERKQVTVLARASEPEALQLVAEARLALGQPVEARRAAAEAIALMTERATYGYVISAYGALRALLPPGAI
jgi:hypothetical protein